MAALQPFDLVVTSTELLLRKPATGGAEDQWYGYTVVQDNQLSFSRKDAKPAENNGKRVAIDAVYGIFQLLRGYYLAVITRSTRIATGPYNAPVYQVGDMDWFHVPAQKDASVIPLTAAEEEEEIARISETRSFYFAVGYDLTNSLQRNDAFAASATTTMDGVVINAAALRPKEGVVVTTQYASWRNSDDRFFWNRAACKELMAASASELITPIINGFVDSRAAKVDSYSVVLMLISRRGCTRQGTRFHMRGADSEGSVANYAETEQIVLFDNGASSSYMQIRGSIPLLWDQAVSLKYTPRAKLSANAAGNMNAFSKHVTAQLTRYGRFAAINLIDKKKDQEILGKAYEKAVAELNNPSVRYVWFDFHHECRKMQWQNLSKLLNEVSTQIEEDGFYAKDSTGVVTKVQLGVLRTNCMDNLDRTNVVQSLFARRAALAAIPGALDAWKASASSVLTSPFPSFESAFNNLWANNADAVSILYSGTGALKTDFTRTGKRTYMGALNDGVNSVMRYVLNNFVDGRTQDAWDLFLGRYIPKRHHSHRSFKKSASNTAADAVETVTIVTPLKVHAAGITPLSFLLQSFLVFAGISTLVALSFTSSSKPLAERLAVGASVGGVVIAGLAYILMSKGHKLGSFLVSKPQFLPQSISTRLISDASGSAVEIPTLDHVSVGDARIKTA